ENGWSIEVVDRAGRCNSLALDSEGHPHISYYGEAYDDLKYARWDGNSWNIEVVDSTDVGSYNSLALDSKGYPHISYNDFENDDLKYARWDGNSWNIEIVDSSGDTGYYNSLAIDSKGYPHISYYERFKKYLKYARWTGDSWDIEAVERVGFFLCPNSLALDDSDYPHISYIDSKNDDLKYARWDGNSWNIEVVDSTDVGSYNSLALDSKGYPHIVYYDQSNKDLKYVEKKLPAAPTSPRDLQATSGNGYVTLTWQPPVDDGSSPITEYKIYRGTTTDRETLIATIGDILSYVDDNVTNGETYYYRVAAINEVGEGPSSKEVNATPIASQEIETTMDYGWILILFIGVGIISAILVFILRR
ncbi:MAG TPA: hypothetical protein ENI49_03080, partial [Thermoplasmatales archaeon]|nr:hypothetical protein [Thermoplasmatales archaeon]